MGKQKRTGNHRSKNLPVTPDEGDQAQPQTPDTEIYEAATMEDTVTPTLTQWEYAIKTAAEETLEKITGEKRKDYISHSTWEKITEYDKLNKKTYENVTPDPTKWEQKKRQYQP